MFQLIRLQKTEHHGFEAENEIILGTYHDGLIDQGPYQDPMWITAKVQAETAKLDNEYSGFWDINIEFIIREHRSATKPISKNFSLIIIDTMKEYRFHTETECHNEAHKMKLTEADYIISK